MESDPGSKAVSRLREFTEAQRRYVGQSRYAREAVERLRRLREDQARRVKESAKRINRRVTAFNLKEWIHAE